MSLLFLSPTAPSWRCQAGKKPLNTRQGRAPKVDAIACNSSLAMGTCIITRLCERAEQPGMLLVALTWGLCHLLRALDGASHHQCPMPPFPVFSSPLSAHSRRWLVYLLRGWVQTRGFVCVKHVFSHLAASQPHSKFYG